MDRILKEVFMSNKTLDRIKDWRNFRKSIENSSENKQIKENVLYWSKMPTVNFVLNYNEFNKWPTPWDIVSEGYYDSIAIAYLMMETLILLGWDKKRFSLNYIKPDESSDFIMVLIIDDKNVLNYSYNEVYNIKNYTYDRCIEKLQYNDDGSLEKIK